MKQPCISRWITTLNIQRASNYSLIVASQDHRFTSISLDAKRNKADDNPYTGANGKRRIKQGFSTKEKDKRRK